MAIDQAPMQEWSEGALFLNPSIRRVATGLPVSRRLWALATGDRSRLWQADEHRSILPKGTAINQSYLGYRVLSILI